MENWDKVERQGTMFVFHSSILNENPQEKYQGSPSHNVLMGEKEKMKSKLGVPTQDVSSFKSVTSPWCHFLSHKKTITM